MVPTRIFLDTEFTELTSKAELISLGLVDEFGRAFYWENSDYCTDATRFKSYNPGKVAACSPFVRDNVVPSLFVNNPGTFGSIVQMMRKYGHGAVTTVTSPIQTTGDLDWRAALATDVANWLWDYERVEIWADVPAYDWMLFADLFGGSMKIPENVSYIPRDIATMMVVKGVDPDINRLDFVGRHFEIPGGVHNALYDAFIVGKCHAKLLMLP